MNITFYGFGLVDGFDKRKLKEVFKDRVVFRKIGRASCRESYDEYYLDTQIITDYPVTLKLLEDLSHEFKVSIICGDICLEGNV